MIIALLLYPGGWLIDASDPLDFQETLKAYADNDNLTHAVSFVIILCSLLISYGIFSFWRLQGPSGSLGHSMLRFGILVNLFHYGIYILTMGTRHLLVAVSQHADSLADPAGAPELMLVLHAVSGGLHFAFVTVSSVSGVLVGIGLARRFSSLNLTAAACWVFGLAGVAGLINVVVGQQAEVDPEAFIMVSNIVLFVAAAALLLIGIGVIRGEKELIPEDD
ncbi:MAG: hypothetical protein F4Y97_06185 [Dehalococcoidia bacterium]|nr:hypothetical protein [Dehalococcoidia bacterium]MXY72614.1 hypothetical protein [Dehalococcoidia bacterium]MYD29960.1 hypothetical protein [Dehalococcoidia bacterium]MYK26392.1 hypothetical protein [Dehalococcoidia bacterium]